MAGVVLIRVLGVGLGSLGLPAVVLACPLMVFFMMRAMIGMQGGQADRSGRDQRPSQRR